MDEEQLRKLREEMGETTLEDRVAEPTTQQTTAQTSGLNGEQIQQLREELGAEPTSDPYETRPIQQTPKRTTTKKADDTQTQPTTQIPSLPTIPQGQKTPIILPSNITLPKNKDYIQYFNTKKIKENYSINEKIVKDYLSIK